MLVLNLQDVMIEAATELAISGAIDVPVDNQWGGVDVFLPGVVAHRGRNFYNGVRFVEVDGSIVMYKFAGSLVCAEVTFKGEMVSSSVLVAIAKEWL
jgi:hypothetical protein